MRALACLAAAVAASTFAMAPALAHSLLVTPPPISPDDSAKSGPCGCYFGAGPQDPNDDPSPSACPGTYTITSIEAGSKLKVEWKETINHDGAFRVAFTSKAPEDATKADMDNGVLVEMTDENPTSGATLSATVTLPSAPCELCTIQLRQYMMGAAQPYYYSCAAVKLVAPAGTGGAGGGGGSGIGGDPGSGGTNAGGSGAGASMGQGGTFSTGAGKAEEPAKVASSCSIQSPGDDRARGASGLALVGIALALSALRRRSSAALRERGSHGRG